MDDGDDEEANEEDVPADARVRHKRSSFLVRLLNERASRPVGIRTCARKRAQDVRRLFSRRTV